MVKIVYFAWVRERIGKGEEELDIPAEVKSAGDLVAWLSTLGDGYAEALRVPRAIRVAVNQEHVEHHESISGAHEIGIFPPMTGG